MNYCFCFKERHTVTVANKNVYVTPVIHPSRCLLQHDFVYILDGSWQIGIEGMSFSVQKGDVIILPANMYHYGLNLCADNTKTFFLHTSIAEGDGLITNETPFLKGKKCALPLVIKAKNSPEVKELFSKIIFAFKENNALKASVLFDMLLVSLYETVEDKSIEDNTATQIKSIIDNNLHKSVDIAYISKKLGISTKTAEMKFKKKFGTTIHQYALSQKMLLAGDYLKFYPHMKIYEIALNLGFYDEYHFSHRFKKHFGISPTKYRNSVNSTEEITCT